MGIWRRNLDQRNVDRQVAVLEEAFDLMKEDRSVIGAAVVHRLAHVAADKKCVVAEMAFHLGRHISARSERQHMDDFDVFYMGAALHQRFDQRFGFRTAG